MPGYTGFGTTAADKPLSRLTFERRDVGKNDVKIDILFCGVCHSDSNSIVVDERFVLRIPKAMDLASTAPLLCAGITLYSPLRH